MHILKSWPVHTRIVAAVGIFVACLVLRLAILPVEAGLAFLTFYPGTAFVALFCGVAPTLIYIAMAGLAGTYIFVPPYWSLSGESFIPVIAFSVSATTILLVIHFVLRRVTTERKLSDSFAQSERFIRFITDAMPALVAYWDKDLRCKFANRAYTEWWGKTPEYIKSATLKEVMGESLFSVNESFIRGALAGEPQHFERYLTKPDGSVGHVLANYVPDTDAHGKVLGFIIIVTDIKSLRIAESEVKLAASIYQNIAEGVMVTDMNGVILSVNPAFTEITGYPAQEAVGHTPRLLRSDRHNTEFHASVWSQIKEQGQWKGELWNRRKSGEVYLGWQTITKIPGVTSDTSRYVSVFHDITDTWTRNEDNRHLAFHDALTNLPNRSLLLERLERRIVASKRDPRRIAVMFIDLDRFKEVNDTLGHASGDELLIVIARKLQSLVRTSDTVARIGGDEFVIKLDNPATMNEVVQIADRVVAVIGEPVDIHGNMVQVGASIGVAMYPDDGASAAELLASADTAMYAAKRAGKNRYAFVSPELASKADAK
jgi:diguanylate cyclase (GGDEF)-like protein/PAS domain S-box-containing protein